MRRFVDVKSISCYNIHNGEKTHSEDSINVSCWNSLNGQKTHSEDYKCLLMKDTEISQCVQVFAYLDNNR